MRYSYSAAWSIVGGISLPSGASPIELAPAENCRFILTSDPDELLAPVDRGAAAARLLLKGITGSGSVTANSYTTALQKEIQELRAERKAKAGSGPFLVLQASGEIPALTEGPRHETEEFILTFDAVNNDEIRQRHKQQADAMRSAVTLESESTLRFHALGDGSYLVDPAGKMIYSLTFKFSAELNVSRALTEAGAQRISARYVALQQHSDLNSVERLLSQMSDRSLDRLKAFLAGWAALEILVSKSFKAYEQEFLSPFSAAGQSTVRDRFLKRITDVMKDKYRLADKFLAVSAVFFPRANDSEADGDYQSFYRLKEIRDSIYHGDQFSEAHLPIDELATLLRKYILACLEVSARGADLTNSVEA